MRDIIYNELMKVYAKDRSQDPIYIANTCDQLSFALADYLNEQNDWMTRAVYEQVKRRILLVIPGDAWAEKVTQNVLNILMRGGR
jgi:hypothetical protein